MRSVGGRDPIRIGDSQAIWASQSAVVSTPQEPDRAASGSMRADAGEAVRGRGWTVSPNPGRVRSG